MKVNLVLISFLFICHPVFADIVKKSSAGICHDTNSPSYGQIKKSENFKSIEDCLSSGGRLPKNVRSTVSQMDDAVQEAKNQKRRFSLLYNRDEWPHWIDEDRNGLNTRQQLLFNTSLVPVTFTNSAKKTVKSGRWLCPYSGKIIEDAQEVDIDHIVPLHWANGHGGDIWPTPKKQQFANDMESNLLVVDDNLNREKSAQGPDTWMPPLHTYRCAYLKKFDDVVTKYVLEYTPSEKRTIQRMLHACQAN